jgi:hypothetical protein
MKPASACLLALLLVTPAAAWAETAVYSVHVGVNSPPPGSELPSLRYADDDAARFYQFVRPFAKRAVLATVLDEESQRRHPALAGNCISPRRDLVQEKLAEMAASMQTDRDAGKNVVLYLSYSGHGVREADETALVLLDGHLDRRFLEEKVLSLPANVIHLFIDACHAQGLVARRGVIEKEVSARSRVLSEWERSAILRDDLLSLHPHVGALVAAATDRETHEWSRLQSGVFTHELLSALSGAADVNLDGKIVYSEVAAFISAANRSVKDPLAVIQVVSLPPQINRNAPILALAWIPDAALLEGIPAGLGHFYLETSGGIRALDAHPEFRTALRLMLPPKERIWLRSGDLEASFESRPGKTVHFASLEYRSAETLTARGSIDDSLRKGFFTSSFGASYYRGYVDRWGVVGVEFAEPPLVTQSLSRPSQVPAITCLVGSGLALASTAVFAALAFRAKQDFDTTDLQKPAQEAKTRMVSYQALAVGSGVVSAGLAVAAWLLWPNEPWTVGPSPGTGSMGLSLSFRW